MNCARYPNYKHRAEVDLFDRLMTVNAVHFCRLIYVLMSDPGANFYPKRARAYIESYCEYVRYVQEDNDKEIRRYRFNELLRDAPYISYSRADNILTCQEGFAADAASAENRTAAESARIFLTIDFMFFTPSDFLKTGTLPVLNFLCSLRPRTVPPVLAQASFFGCSTAPASQEIQPS